VPSASRFIAAGVIASARSAAALAFRSAWSEAKSRCPQPLRSSSPRASAACSPPGPIGDERRHPQRGISEGDYYGLRPWQSGDSLRWIHWRTTAKLGRPIVRQFERRRSRDVAIILDPWLPPNNSPDDEAFAELAISFAATALYDISTRGHSRLTLAICSRQPECLSGPASPPFCQELLTHLACIPLSREKTLSAALNQTIETAPRGSRLVVISPRSSTDPSLSESTLEIDIDPDDLAWIDVSSEQLASLFTLEN
jgi:uncharacterized protein (DUF58 family)